MSKSIIQDTKECYICGSQRWLEEHHCFHASNRKISEKYGLKVWLCHYCHNEPPNGIHQNKKNREALQDKVQRIAMEHYGWDVEDFRKIFGRNYLKE